MKSSPTSCRTAGFSFAATLAVASLVAAQQQPEPTHEPWHVPIHTAADDLGVPYGIWAAGTSYKVSFHDGATFVPVLGKDYPHNQTWSWRTESARIGALELVQQEPRLSHGKYRAEYDLGGIVEAYDVRADGIEQTFVLASPPQQTGDLVIRGVVQSMLTSAATTAGHRSLSFLDAAGREIVTYGAATAIDARGQKLAMTTAFENDRVTLRLDGAWLAAASYPVVVDPVVMGNATLVGDPIHATDVVRDSESFTHGTWTSSVRYNSATDYDLAMHRWLDDGNVSGTMFIDITMNWDTRGGRLAYNAGSNYVICVFDREFAGGTRALRYHRHHRNDSTQSTAYTAISTSGNAWRADVGGTDMGFSGMNALVVWQEEANAGAFVNTNSSDVYGCTVNLLGNTVGTPFLIAGSVFTDVERPSINQVSSGAINNSWRVAYQSRSSLVVGDDWDIAVTEVTDTPTVSPAVWIDNASPDHKTTPYIEGTDGRYLVAFVTTPTAQGAPSDDTGMEVRSARIDWPMGGLGTLPWPTATVKPAASHPFRIGSVGYDRHNECRWIVVSHSVGGSVHGTRANHLGYRGAKIKDNAFPNPTVGYSVDATHVSFDEFTDEFVCVQTRNSTTVGRLDTARISYPAVAPPSVSGISCSQATIAWSGLQFIGSEYGSISITGAAPDSLHVMALSMASAAVPLIGVAPFSNGCFLNISSVAPDFVGLFYLQVGDSVTYPLPLPEILGTDIYYFQDFHTIGNGNLDMVSTQLLELPLVR